jgi:hypothetical protein
MYRRAMFQSTPIARSAIQLQAFGHTTTEQCTKYDATRLRICLNKQPKVLLSSSVDVIALATSAAYVSRIILVIPNSATRSRLFIFLNDSACKALAALGMFPGFKKITLRITSHKTPASSICRSMKGRIHIDLIVIHWWGVSI